MKPTSRIKLTSFFVTGTDTGVGKTHVTALLLAELRRRGINAAGFKPIACGADGRNDAQQYRAIMGHAVPLSLINPVYLRRPLSPHVAAHLDGQRIPLAAIRRAYVQLSKQFDLVLVEGAGGLQVPITTQYLMSDLARDLDLPVIVVARLGLGTINHSLLTIQAARIAGLDVRGVILNDTTGHRGLAERTNIVEVPRLTGTPLLGVVPHGPSPKPGDIRSLCDALLKQCSR
jgi:dethiobiotin synthetase